MRSNEVEENNFREEKTTIKNNSENVIESFAIAMAKVLSEDRECRELIKTEALKMIDYDYDVLYMLVKDIKLSNGKTMENKILKYLNLTQHNQLIKEIPTLTMFVPKLIYDSFSAEQWKTESEKPCVAYIDEKNVVNYIDSLGNKKKLAYNEIPLFPIIVLKKSERIILNSTKLRSNFKEKSTIMIAGNGLEFTFDDVIFDNINQKNKTRLGTNKDIPSKMKKMFDAVKIAKQNNIWQRDYIYYNIDQISGRGAFNNTYGEHLYSFQLLGDANNAYKYISDQDGDPHHNDSFSWGPRYNQPPWTDGEFEFWVNVKLASKTAVGDGLRKKFKAKGDDLFELDFYSPNPRSNTLFVKGVKRTKKYIFPEPIYLFSWDLEKFSDAVKITIEEQDDPETITNTEKTTSSFATNFEFNVSIGEKEKVGGKFGSSMSESKEVLYSIVTTKNSDNLGDIYMTFGQDVLASEHIIDNNLRAGKSFTRGRRPTYYPNYIPSFNPSYISGDSYKIEVAAMQIY